MLPPAFWTVVAGLVGACVGSFLNVVIWRLPRRESLVHPRSRCPRCQRPIRWADNLPVLSWLLLRGRCRGCRAPISARYPLVEALTALLFVLAALRYAGQPVDGVVVALLLAALVAVTFIDIDHRIIPDAITKPGMVAAVVLAFVPAVTLHPRDLVRDAPGLSLLLHAGGGVLTGLCVVYVVRFLGGLVFRKEAMGRGDAKLLGLIGGFTGPVGALYALTLACLGGALVHGLVVAWRRGRPKPLTLRLRGAAGEATFERAWVQVATGGAVRVELDRGAGSPPLPPDLGEPPGALRLEAVLPKVSVLTDEDVTVRGRAERIETAPAARSDRLALRLTGLSAEDAEHLAFFAASHRYLPFGPYLALGGAAAALYAAEVSRFLTVTYPRWIHGLLG